MADEYEEVGHLGSGGFGDVKSVRRRGSGTLFARKTLTTDDPSAIRRFSREVRILSSLDHPNIVRIIDKRLDANPYFYVMPLYRQSLRAQIPSIVGDEARIEPVLRALLDAMEHAHTQGVIHRDLKPENILMNSDTEVVVSDFGLGRELDAETTRQTGTGEGMGTLLYMAPEQLHDAKNADARSDVYSIGRIIYELYSGPIMSAIQDTSKLPTGIRLIVTKCTQQDPDRRFQTVGELKAAWGLIVDSAFHESERAELERLRAEFASATTLDRSKVHRLFDLLLRHADDRDLLHQTFMQLPAPAVALVASERVEDVRGLVIEFAEFTQEQSWSFEYTDRIADVCRELYDQFDDAEARAALIECLLVTGSRHNRWYVLGVVSRLLSTRFSRDEEIAIATRLRDVDPNTRAEVAGRVKAHSQLIADLFASLS